MNRSVLEALDAISTNATLQPGLHLGQTELEGRMLRTYRGIPIEVSDALLNTETAVA
jgi:hypothetical protein